ncbi:MAG: polyphosphate kinase 1 [Spirochaetaceae bacterium]|jgi:polyphosphate kinase|nr:polyphosphate kinase 1 [Spirochaetaceae bacterium]
MTIVNFFNRDLSWIDFNRRVLDEGLRPDLPPLDRFRFLSIVSSNFDEFFMVRLAAIKRAQRAGAGADQDPAGLGPEAQLKAVAEKVRDIVEKQYRCLRDEIFPALEREGLELVRPDKYSLEDMDFLESFFMREIYPVLTPLRFGDDEADKLMIDTISIHAAFLLETEAAASPGETAEYISIVKIPPVVDRIIRLPNSNTTGKQPGDVSGKGNFRWALLDDVILSWGAYLFPGYTIKGSMLFNVNRDADFSVDEKRDEDFMEAMEEVIERRDSSRVVRMVYTAGSARLREALARRFELGEDDLYEIDGPLDLSSLSALAETPGFDRLRLKARRIHPQPALNGDESLWDRISQGDVMLHLPYQSFDPVLRFFRDAARDPQVISIKTTLYRTGGDSPVIRALEDAALNGKHVTALVELKARFDEARNISWANRLEKAGVIVVYGLARLKVHAKITLVIRREQDGIKRYVHLSTGNYNHKTAMLYEDIGMFTAWEDIAFDAGLLFNMITGYSVIQATRQLVIAPANLKRRLIELIDREAKRSSPQTPGRIMAKMNSLADSDVIQALYRASQAGVRILLNIRGICMLVPGAPGLSENIQVISIVDRYLEHSRIVCFANGGNEEVYLSSADWMPRNLERRVELMFPVLQADLREEVRGILEACFHDNQQSWQLGADGVWTRRAPEKDEEPFRAQEYFLAQTEMAAENPWAAKEEFIVRRGSPVNRKV